MKASPLEYREFYLPTSIPGKPVAYKFFPDELYGIDQEKEDQIFLHPPDNKMISFAFKKGEVRKVLDFETVFQVMESSERQYFGKQPKAILMHPSGVRDLQMEDYNRLDPIDGTSRRSFIGIPIYRSLDVQEGEVFFFY